MILLGHNSVKPELSCDYVNVTGLFYVGKTLCGHGVCNTCNVIKTAIKMRSKKQCISCYTKYYRKNNKKYLVAQKNRRALSENKLKDKKYNKNYRLRNKDKVNQYKNDYRKNNPLSRRGENQFRERTIKNQIIAKQYRKQILSFYKNTPEGFQVDHIIPIMHKDVCGLHVPWNLQYLSPIDNNKKNNHWDGTCDNKGWLNE